MKPFVKAIIAGGCIILIGLIIMLVGLGLNGWTLSANFSAQEFNARQENNEIVVENSVGPVKINYYDGEKVQIFYPESDNYKPGISEYNGVVRVTSPQPKWYEFSLWSSKIPETIINLPKSTEFKLNLTVNAGSLRILDGKYSSMRLTVNAGSLNATNVECDTFNAKVNAGTMQINNLTCATYFDGEVNAGSFNVKSLISPKITADVSAGSLNMKIEGKKSEYRIDVHVSAGSSNISSQAGTTDKSLKADVSAGSLNVSFTS